MTSRKVTSITVFRGTCRGPTSKRYANQSLKKCYKLNEKEKKRAYAERVLQVEHGSFTPLVSSAIGGMGRETTKFYSRLAEILADKKNTQYSFMMAWLERKIVSLINSVPVCIRGSRSCRSDELDYSENPVASGIISKLHFFVFFIKNQVKGLILKVF